MTLLAIFLTTQSTMEKFNGILLIMISVIFGLTAILALASIPDWIKIPEWYKKKLFLALIIEIIAIVLGHLGSDILGSKGKGGNNNIDPANYVERNKEQTLTPKPDSSMKFLYIHGNDTLPPIGKLPISSLECLNLFNTIDYDQSKDHVLIKWAKVDNVWQNTTEEIEDCPLFLRIRDLNEYPYGTAYEIIDRQNPDKAPRFSSANKAIEYFNESRRVVHVFDYTNKENGKQYYTLFRIVSANLTPGQPNHVYVLQMRIKPVWK